MQVYWVSKSVQTLERSYLLRIDGKVVERPQQMLMRVAVGIHGEDVDAAIETYNLMSERVFTHASPTLFSSATPRPQLSRYMWLQFPSDCSDKLCYTIVHSTLLLQIRENLFQYVFNFYITCKCSLSKCTPSRTQLHYRCGVQERIPCLLVNLVTIERWIVNFL